MNLKSQSIYLYQTFIETPLGTMTATADLHTLYALMFSDQQDQAWIEDLALKMKKTVMIGLTDPLRLVQTELHDYFSGRLKKFTTPKLLHGTAFQQVTWKALEKIPYGHTKSYTKLAESIEKPLACRAVGNANGANPMAIVVPCHRVIQRNGQLGGYSSGLWRKKWLLEHEQNCI